MSNYELGKDICEIKQQLKELKSEVALLTRSASRCKCSKCESVEGEFFENKNVIEGVRSKTAELSGRIRDEECWCEAATLTLKSDGSYEFRSSQRNSSSTIFDPRGDIHEMYMEIRKKRVPNTVRLVYSFKARKRVDAGEREPLNKNGSDSSIKDNYDEIRSVSFNINCE